jgi:hypothetical protein
MNKGRFIFGCSATPMVEEIASKEQIAWQRVPEQLRRNMILIRTR